MRTIRAMSLSTLVLLGVAAVACWHISYAVVDDQNTQGNLYVNMMVWVSTGIIVSTAAIIIAMIYGNDFGRREFIGELITAYICAAVGGVIILAIIAGMVIDDSNPDTPYNWPLFGSVVAGFFAGSTVSFWFQVLVHGNESWTNHLYERNRRRSA